MATEPIESSYTVPRWLILATAVCVAVGVWLRFSTLGVKLFYRLEVYASVYSAGYSLAQARQELRTGSTTTGALLEQYESPSSKSVPDTIGALYSHEVSHPPLFYVTAWFWERALGHSIAVKRALAAVFGVLLIPAMFWLAWELFRSPAAAYASAALTAISPYQLVFAQEFIDSGLFQLLAVVAGALLIRAFRTGSGLAWVSYGLALTLMFYSSVLSVLVLLAFIAYALVCRSTGHRKSMPAFGLSSALPVVLFSPWTLTFARHSSEASQQGAYEGTALPLGLYGPKLIFTFGAAFFDAEYADARWVIILVPVLAIAIYSIWVVIRHVSSEAKGFVLAFGGVTLLFFALSDVVLHASRVVQQRYLLVSVAAVILSVAYALTRTRRAWNATALIMLLVAGMFSSIVASSKASWWNNNDTAGLAKAGAYVQHDPNAVALFDDAFVALQFSNLVPPTVRVAMDPRSAAQAGEPIYAVDVHRSTLRTLRALTGLPGMPVSISVQEQKILNTIHQQVIKAYRLTRGASGVTLWKFSP